ncbi:unnamed protein product [Orchesella dallaii]|uniref:Transport and Golgi organization protein 2 n=1 Tax=Orchesella dallaii TaxID=48710 RepID=A0ABP1PYQ1_9HEXA
MCILFMYFGNLAKESPTFRKHIPKMYKLIIASNRDEYYKRTAKAANFWENLDSHILAGQDTESLGTWLGISKFGKLSIILNVYGGNTGKVQLPYDQRLSRGGLVTGFLRSPPGLSSSTYCNSICQDPDNLDIQREFSGFHLINVDIRDKFYCYNKNTKDPASISGTYLSNCIDCIGAKPYSLTPRVNTGKFFGVSNSTIERPYRKVVEGLSEFKQIVGKYSQNEVTEDSGLKLKNDILQLMRSRNRHFPDEVMMDETHIKETGLKTEEMEGFSKINIHNADGGTRAQNIILVDSDNNVTYYDWTVKHPIASGDEKEWEENEFNFQLTPTN